jgi:hypothetical protein
MAGDVLIETTARRDAYWGVVFRDDAATAWASLALAGTEYPRPEFTLPAADAETAWEGGICR